MTYRIPSKASLEAAVLKVLRRSPAVGSLSRLTTMVAEEIERTDPTARVGPERIRRLVARSDHVRTTIHTRRGDAEGPPARCPVCRGKLETVRNRTLSGGDIALNARCTECSYWTGRERRVPVRYVFHLREWRF